jgi:hypothetical protein
MIKPLLNWKLSKEFLCSFPYIFFTIKDLNYDNEIFLDHGDVVNMIKLNFANITVFVFFFYVDK